MYDFRASEIYFSEAFFVHTNVKKENTPQRILVIARDEFIMNGFRVTAMRINATDETKIQTAISALVTNKTNGLFARIVDATYKLITFSA